MGDDDDRARHYQRITAELRTSAFAGIRYVARTASTNQDACALLGDRRCAGLTIVAEHQTHGAGRKGRSWIARPGTALLFTTILPHALPTGDLWAVPFWVGLAVRRALLAHDIPTRLHWPNDLLAAGYRKIAGILCVSRVTGDTAWAACGVGINVHRLPEAEAGIDPPPAYCDDVAPVKREALLRTILEEYEATLELLASPERVAAQWETASGLPGARYQILKDGEMKPFEATALALAPGGGLVVERDDGTQETIALADARALRRATT